MARSRIVIPAIVAIVAVVGIILMVRPLFAVPETQAQIENHLDRPVLDYEIIDETPLVLVRLETDSTIVFLDTIRLDPISHDWPPFPRWQWIGAWERIDASDGEATGRFTDFFGPRVVFGEVQDDRIVRIEIRRSEQVIAGEAREGDGYIIHASEAKPGDIITFLDADGLVVQEIELVP